MLCCKHLVMLTNILHAIQGVSQKFFFCNLQQEEKLLRVFLT